MKEGVVVSIPYKWIVDPSWVGSVWETDL